LPETSNEDEPVAEAQLAFDRGDFASAIFLAKKAVGLGEDARAHVVMGDAYLKLNDFSRASSAYRTALRLDPDSAGARAGLDEIAKGLEDRGDP
jgi:Flp pilus assembly protein TadD